MRAELHVKERGVSQADRGGRACQAGRTVCAKARCRRAGLLQGPGRNCIRRMRCEEAGKVGGGPGSEVEHRTEGSGTGSRGKRHFLLGLNDRHGEVLSG